MKVKIKDFGDLHVPGNPLILYNIWDAGSAKAVADAGAKAIATGSYGVAGAHGFKDGETFPVELVLSNLTEILNVTDLPVTLDFESGYGDDPAAVQASVARAADAGAVGINIEDKDPVTRILFETADAAARIKAAAASGLWINARADSFIVTQKEAHDAALADAVVERAKAYADAGANSLFVPFVYDAALIARICENSPLPVNILVGDGIPDINALAALGVARISHGHGPWAKAMQDLGEAAKAAMASLNRG
jgi:2-methylisocitrate lyase-like PEP mutase family enzyme